jgi:SRSO17 transposase
MVMKTYGQLHDSLQSFLETHLADLENEERIEALMWYCQGLGLELPHKNVYGIATRLQPDNVESCRQRMQRGIQHGRFSHSQVFQRLQATVFENEAGRFDAYVLDDTGIAKKGNHSVGVHRQYSGTLGKVGNCQVVVSLHAASDNFSVCLDNQLYLPKAWTENSERLRKAGVPEEIEFQTKPEIGLKLLSGAVNRGAPKKPVVVDAAFGDNRDLREGINAIGLDYVAAISSNITVWPPGTHPQRLSRTGRTGRPCTQDRDPQGAKPMRVDRLAKELWSQNRFRNITWREGTKGKLSGHFCAVRVRSAERRTKGQRASEPVWLLLERDESQTTGFKYYLSSFQQTTSIRKLVRTAKLRWRVERDYQDMKQNLGFDQYEGRKWGGFHRHLAMVALVHAFLAINREAFSPGVDGEFLDVGGFPPCPTCGADALDRSLSHVSAHV